jgi:hypothetical protein
MIYRVIKKEQAANLVFQQVFYKSSNMQECFAFVNSRKNSGEKLVVVDSFDEIIKRAA